MPFVRITMLEGRDIDKKRRLVEGVTNVVADVCEVNPTSVDVLIEEVSLDNWAEAGALYADTRRAAGTSRPSGTD
jgi:4-oxalocrotonate tautomerase